MNILNAVTCSNQVDSTIVPVINDENELVGVITTNDLLKTIGNFAGTNEIGGIIVLKWNAASLPFQRSAGSWKVMMQPSSI
ncbi:MAG: hypothetical protein IPL50_16845 [Chitinophagaceae bacterium]|nr:hypothetical protein [Chitinophagaceae bacterium]